MSVRLPVGLRSAIGEAAARANKSVTGFVIEILERAVKEESDPFVGLAADLAGHTRALLAEAVEAGTYAAAADEVDAAEERSTAG
jgi:plasmid stability protein